MVDANIVLNNAIILLQIIFRRNERITEFYTKLILSSGWY